MMIFEGEIKVNKEKDYGYFSLDTAIVRKAFKKPIAELRIKMKERNIHGSLYICRFDDFDGKFAHKIVMF